MGLSYSRSVIGALHCREVIATVRILGNSIREESWASSGRFLRRKGIWRGYDLVMLLFSSKNRKVGGASSETHKRVLVDSWVASARSSAPYFGKTRDN